MTTTSTGYLCPQCGAGCAAHHFRTTAVYLVECTAETCPTHREPGNGMSGTIRGAYEDFAAGCELAGLTAWADAAARDGLHRGAAP